MTAQAEPAPSSPFQPLELWRSGARALREGDPAEAARLFEAIVRGGGADATVFFGLALANGRLGDRRGQMAALDEVLSLEPRNMRALMMRADVLADGGDLVAASSFYRAVVGIASADAALSDDLKAEARRAAAALSAYEGRFEAHLRRRLAGQGLASPSGRRVAESLDLLLGRSKIYLQEPKQYYFPGLAQIPFQERGAAPWLEALEAETATIREELQELLREEGLFKPYVEREPDRPFFDNLGLADNPDWSALYLIKSGELVAENAARCPRTMKALEALPFCRIPGRAPSVLFSLLRPGTRIPPHNGLLNCRLIGHLPLIVPDGCGLRVGNDIRTVEVGRGWLFDDSIEHEAWNESDRARVILIFDVWRPELTAEERRLVAELLTAVDSFSGAAPEPAA